MSDSAKLEKAIIQNRDRPGSKPVVCMFNPKEYAFQKSNSWKEGDTPAQNISQLQFTGGKSATLTMQLFFDTYEERSDVREKYTDAFWELMTIDSRKKDKRNKFGRPPLVLFQWGRTWSFQAVITQMKQQFTLFLDSGVPVRATLDVTFQQVSDPGHLRAQNPTSGGMGGERIWRVQAGDTLPWIAYREYGDATMWRLIAEANRMTRVRELVPGTILVIPNE